MSNPLMEKMLDLPEFKVLDQMALLVERPIAPPWVACI